MVRIIRWVCEKCNKKWIYPVPDCISCKGPIKKVVGKKATVAGWTKVYVPCPPHPIVPYNVLMLVDEHGNKMPKKTMKDYAIGDSYHDEPSEEENAVAIVKIKYDYSEAVDEAFELIGGLPINAKTKVLIKPNLSIPSPSYLGLVTNEKVLDALLGWLLGNGVKKSNITVAEQSFFAPLSKIAEKTGAKEILEKYGLPLADISQHPFVEKKEREFTFSVSKLASECDIMINLPVIKTDMYIGLDGAFENLVRFLSKENFERLSQDKKKAAQALAALPKVFPRFVTLGDASIGLQGNGPAEQGEPGFYNILFAARNPVVHDITVSYVFCLPEPPFASLAGKSGLGEYRLERIKAVGNEMDAVRREVKLPLGSPLLKQKANAGEK
ncbi:DUF362 domain-containing protein [Candidatus Woesearchaeota archaeon]|nr:DUF362 domain-containing protein [Candidatus Woesearchaeota archaeon]